MKNSLLETIVGFVVILIAAIFLCYGYFSTTKKMPGGVVRYEAVFDSIGGIIPNSEVCIGGVCVGFVSKIELKENYRIGVCMKIRKDIKIPEDSSAEIMSAGIMGDKFIAIIPGGSNKNLKEGQCFNYSKSSMNFESFLNKVVSEFLKSKK